MPTPTLSERLRYRFDVWMAGGTVALMGLLGLATLIFVVVLGIITWVVLAIVDDKTSADPDDDAFDFIWGSLMRALDPGTMGGDRGWWFRLLMLIVTNGGLVIVASLIGIVSGAADSRVEQLRKGRSRVLEKDHTLILGWNPKVFTIVQELATANESRGRSHIVILADRDKVDMEDLPSMPTELNQYVAPGSIATIVTRGESRVTQNMDRMAITHQRGDATQRSFLESLDPTSYDHVVVLADMSINAEQADSRTLVTLLQLRDIARRNGKDLNIVTGETAIGFSQAANSRNKAEGYGVRLNPTKSERLTFAAGDEVIVLAEA
ncbi:hypothetical protein ACQUSY_12660 [Microbacterium sp. YY-03]|uniref:hypothetical protein n=1 Tax=Microbacterium sp. YY-03 TaxID=3421636 RepID=UPI003D168470